MQHFEKQGEIMSKSREPIAAGRFYPAEKKQLYSDVKNYLDKSKVSHKNKIAALIVPHAGYIFSGQIAADAYSSLPQQAQYENIFIIGSSHTSYFQLASIYNEESYSTPLGTVYVNQNIVNDIINTSSLYQYHPEAHKTEHSIEVQLPFLQVTLDNNYKIVPIILGSGTPSEYQQIAEVLKPYFNKRNLFIISSDLSHYPNSRDAIFIDSSTIEAIISGDTFKFLDILKRHEDEKIIGLRTSACGWSAILTLMYLTKNNHYKYKKLTYCNSGDSEYGDKNEVVGYCSIKVSRDNKQKFILSDAEKEYLLQIAEDTLISHLNNDIRQQINNPSNNLNTHCGAFVTLTSQGKLRGCMGQFETKKPLYKLVQEMVITAAVDDYRFPNVTKEEIEDIEIEISVLSPLKKINDINEITLGKHGIYIVDGLNKGTLLPQVATDRGWTKEEFLGYCSRDKAGIGWYGWKKADIYIYEAIIINKKDVS